MKRVLSVLAVVGLFAVAALVGNTASAGHVWKATLTSTDAGATNVAAISRNTAYSILCDIPACYRTGTSSTVVPDCAKDFTLQGGTAMVGYLHALLSDGADAGKTEFVVGNTQNAPLVDHFRSGAHSYIAAKALDAGNPNCRVLQDLQ